jgi:sulfoxide reductase heme-binding subunit YedZ
VALILLTLSVLLGVLDVRRFNTKRVPRFMIDGAHRYVSLLAVAFLVLHIATAALDSFAPISLVDAVVPFGGRYRPFWLGLGATSFDLLLAVLATSLLRRKLGYGRWKAMHWFAYACWPLALLHGLGTGSDVKSHWMLWIASGCLVTVVLAASARVVSGWPQRPRVRAAALLGTFAFAGALAIWLPSGPLGPHWARRAGTPTPLLSPVRTRS